MNKNELKRVWKNEEKKAFTGWDFSHLDGRTIEEELPWNYEEIVRRHLKPEDSLLDMGTGGGEFVLTLEHPHDNTFVTESYPPNIELCKKELAPLGIHVFGISDDSNLPFEDESMDIIINRHESYDIDEVYRILKKGGRFITQQVGGANTVDISNRICSNGNRKKNNKNTLEYQETMFKNAGFNVIDYNEYFPYLKFLDTGALVYFAKIIEWEFINFSVETSIKELLDIEQEIADYGHVTGKEHRYFIEAVK